jgi:hypothetical protein
MLMRSGVASRQAITPLIFQFATTSRHLNLQRVAEVAGTGSCGQATGVTERTIVGFVAGDLQFEQSARGDVQFETAAAAVNQSASGDNQAAFFFNHANCFASGTTGGPDIFYYEDALAGLDLKSTAQGHLTGAVAFYKQRTNAECARDFIAGEDSAQRGGNNASDGKVPEKIRESAAECFRVLRMFENQGALDVGSAVASAGKLEVAGADGAYLFKEL